MERGEGMVKAIIMPRLDIDMERGSVVEWRKQEGEPVKAGEVVAIIMSEKVTYEVESPASGVLARILVEPEVEVPIGTPIAILAEAVSYTHLTLPTTERV